MTGLGAGAGVEATAVVRCTGAAAVVERLADQLLELPVDLAAGLLEVDRPAGTACGT